MLAVLAAIAANASAAASAGDNPALPAWIKARVADDTPRIATALGLSSLPRIALSYREGDGPAGLRTIDAETRDHAIVIRYTGSWQNHSDGARRAVTRNLAHELAHSWQRSLGLATESRLFHEGFAEALAIEALRRCADQCEGAPDALARQREQDCAYALALGPVIAGQTDEAHYGCGTVLVLAASAASGEPVRALYRAFAATERDAESFLAVAEARAGRAFALSARTFLTANLTLAGPSTVMERLRAGRL